MESSGTEIISNLLDGDTRSISDSVGEHEDQSHSLATTPASSRLESDEGSSPRDQRTSECSHITVEIQEHQKEKKSLDVIKCGKSSVEAGSAPSFSERSGVQRVDLKLPSFTRHHLPSPAELERSTELIDNWKIEITKFGKEISGTKTRHHTAQRQFDNIWFKKEKELSDAYYAALDHLHQEKEEAQKVVEVQNRQEIEVIETSRLAVENRMKVEQAFIAGIRKIPVEVLAEIFRWYVGEKGIPSRILALVSKEWRAVALDTPFLWANLSAFPIRETFVAEASRRLQRCIELSRSTLLNVTLSVAGYQGKDDSDTLFHLLSEIGVERWKYLKIVSGSYGPEAPSSYLGGLFRGSFRSIQTLELDFQIPDQPVFASIFQQILECCPLLVKLDMEKPIALPNDFRNQELFQHVVELRASSTIIQDMLPLPCLQDLCVTGVRDGTLDTTRFPILPATTRFHSLSRSELSGLQLHVVQSLKINDWKEDGNEAIIELPNLHSLNLPSGSLSGIKRLSAPNLHILRIGSSHSGGHPERNGEDIIFLFQNTPQLVLMQPTTVELNISLPVATWLVILQAWHQIQHLTLRLGPSTWKSLFSNGLAKKQNPLCPALISLSMELRTTRAANNGEDLKQIVKKMREGRKKTFKSASWTTERTFDRKWEDISTLKKNSWPSYR